MRGIKFRAWSSAGTYEKAKKQMHYFDLGSKLATVYGNVEHVMQATGLKDKNGKEIYEGDVVKLEQWEPSVYQVGFDRGAFCFFGASETEGAYYNDAKYLEGCEVIGNIYENPDLLK